MTRAIYLEEAGAYAPAGRAGRSFLFDLAPDGACLAILVTKDAVVSYTAVSPLLDLEA